MDVNGVICVHKEAGWTSFDVVAKLRGLLKVKKVGHTGTLDPDATGVLPICVGSATKLAQELSGADKIYETVMLLGKTTDTQDISGKVITESEVSVTEEAVREAVSAFVGEQDQIPPMYSAKKIKGKRLYELAREGVEVQRKPSRINVYSIDITKTELPRIYMKIHCSKGTYIRTLCNDIGEALFCGGCMESLIRTKSGDFIIENALKIGEIENKISLGDFSFIEDVSLR